MVTLHPHQSQGVNYIVSQFLTKKLKAFLLSDGTGLGKTFTASCALMRIQQLMGDPNAKILVVCPLSVIPHWIKSFKELDPTFDRFEVINYNRLKKLFTITTSPEGDTAVYNREEFKYIIFDESHMLKNYSSVSYKLSLPIIEGAAFTLFLSATPAQSPLEVAYLQPILGFTNYFSWLKRTGFAVGKHPTRQHITWNPNPLDIDHIYNQIFPKGMGLQRKPSDIAGWPEQQIEQMPLQLTSAEMKIYDAAFKDYLKARAKAGGKPLNEDTEQMVKASVLRYKISQIKVPHTVTFVKDLLQQGNCKVAIFCEFLKTIETIKESLDPGTALVLTGETSPEDRERIMHEFRYGPAQVIIFNIHQSINLEQPSKDHPKRYQVNHDIPWSGIKAIQANGRCHRNGMHCIIYNVYGMGTIDERIVARMSDRCRYIAKLAGDVTGGATLAQPEFDFFESIIDESP